MKLCLNLNRKISPLLYFYALWCKKFQNRKQHVLKHSMDKFLVCILLLLICIFYRLSSCFKSSSSRFRVWLAPVLINDKFLEELSIVVYCIYFLSDFNVFSMILFPMYFISPPSYSMMNSSEFTCEFSASMPKLMCLDIAVPESTFLLTNEEKTLLLISLWFLNC